MLLSCLCRLQHVSGPIVRGAFLLTQTSCPRSFSVRWRAVIFSFERQSHWDSVCCFTCQWKAFRGNGLLSVHVSTSALCWDVSAPPSTGHSSKHMVHSLTFELSWEQVDQLLHVSRGVSSWRSQPSASSLQSTVLISSDQVADDTLHQTMGAFYMTVQSSLCINARHQNTNKHVPDDVVCPQHFYCWLVYFKAASHTSQWL